jgi:hypothetical protein
LNDYEREGRRDGRTGAETRGGGKRRQRRERKKYMPYNNKKYRYLKLIYGYFNRLHLMPAHYTI